jgi:Cu/Zn superoxide dismutase
MKRIPYTLLLAAVLIALPIVVSAQYKTMTENTNAQKATVTARFINEAANANKKMATVDVSVTGVTINAAKDIAGMGEGTMGVHLHYQLDNGPIIVTPEKKLTFANLSSGTHTIKVTVANGHHQPISETQTLTVKIP